MKTLNFKQKWNPSTKAWRIIVKTDEEIQNETLTKIKNFLKL
jgi:hypothetical protein